MLHGGRSTGLFELRVQDSPSDGTKDAFSKCMLQKIVKALRNKKPGP
jgi:hypothetical protein